MELRNKSLKNAVFTVQQVCPGATKTRRLFACLAEEKQPLRHERWGTDAQPSARSARDGEAIKSRHPTGSLTSHPAERTGGVPLWPRPAENNEIAAWHSYEGCWLAVSE